MVGTRSSGNPAGNPEITKYSYKRNPQNLSGERMDQISIRLEKSQKQKLLAIPGWRDLLRSQIDELLKNVKNVE